MIGSLFSGIGGLEMGLATCGVGPVAWHAESDPAARAVLAERWPDVRTYDDVRAIDETARPVDVICGGFPCQPHSVAGKRNGTGDARWLWPEFARIVGVLRPAAVFIENVPGLRTSGLSIVLADLAALGFDAEWDCFSAAEVGAPHIRRRLFVLAYADREFVREQSRRSGGARSEGPAFAAVDGERGHVADTDREGELQQGGAVGALWRWSGDRRLSPDQWAVEPDVGRVAYGIPARAHRLRLLGNAVVPQTAALAWRTLIARAS